MRLDIEASGYDSAAEALLQANGTVASAHGTLRGRLSGYSAMGGDDTSSEEFVGSYDDAAAQLVGGIADLAVAFGTLATATESSGANHRAANAGSVVQGGGGSVQGGEERASISPQTVSPYSPPSALGGDGGDMPEFWDLIVDHLQGWAWPSADTSRLRDAAEAWRTAAGQIEQTPSCCQVASSHLAAQRSPEIALADAAISEVEGAAQDLAVECRNLAAACDEYAEKVDGTKEVIRGLLKDLAVEAGFTALVGGLASVVTFGGSAVVGGGVILAKTVSCARKIIVALQSIRAIQAVVVLVKTVEKATDVRTLLQRFRTARNLRHRPTGKLPTTGRPNSYGYDRTGARLPYANSRPDYAPGQVNKVWDDAPKNPDGSVTVIQKDGTPRDVFWDGKSPRTGEDGWDMGHRENREYRDLRDQYLSGNIDKQEYLRRYHNPDNYTVQDPGRNRSGMDEATPRRRG